MLLYNHKGKQKGELKMNRTDMEKYRKTSEIDISECYMGTKDCGSCAYAFPGNYALDLMETDCDGTEKDVCRKCKK